MSRMDLVLFPGGKALVMPEGMMGIQCVARTRARRRCQLPVETSQTGIWRELVSKRGIISVYLPSGDALTLQRWLDQHCTTHDTPDVVDETAPEWEPFDPEGRHAQLVQQLPDDWDL